MCVWGGFTRRCCGRRDVRGPGTSKVIRDVIRDVISDMNMDVIRDVSEGT